VIAEKVAVPENAGEAEKTNRFVPVSFVIEDAKSDEAAVVVALLEASRKSARDAVCPESVNVEEAVRALNVAVPENAGDAENTKRFVPVSSDSAEIRFAEVSPFASSDATFDEYEKKPWSPFAIMLAVRLLASTVQVVPLQVKEPKSVACISVGPTDAPKDEKPSDEVATHRVEVPVERST
jgi:hypothetical protein